MPSLDQTLLEHGVKPTAQRMVVAEYVLKTHSHPTAEQVLEAVSGKLPLPLSRATVYNTLNCLVEAGVIREVFTEPGATRYDANLSDHHHFVDTKTGKIYDIPGQDIPQLPKFLTGKFKVHNYQITFFGEIG